MRPFVNKQDGGNSGAASLSPLSSLLAGTRVNIKVCNTNGWSAPVASRYSRRS